MTDSPRPMATVLLEGAKFHGLNVVEEIPEADLESGNVVELPLALVQQWTFARGVLAAAEGSILDWMRRENVKPEFVREMLGKYGPTE